MPLNFPQQTVALRYFSLSCGPANAKQIKGYNLTFRLELANCHNSDAELPMVLHQSWLTFPLTNTYTCPCWFRLLGTNLIITIMQPLTLFIGDIIVFRGLR